MLATLRRRRPGGADRRPERSRLATGRGPGRSWSATKTSTRSTRSTRPATVTTYSARLCVPRTSTSSLPARTSSASTTAAAALYGASASQFKDMVGDILVSEEFSGDIWHVHWNGSTFEKTLLAQVVAVGAHRVRAGGASRRSSPPTSRSRCRARRPTTDVRPGSTLIDDLVGGQRAGRGHVRRQPRAVDDRHASSTPAPTSSALTATDGTLTTSDDVTITSTESRRTTTRRSSTPAPTRRSRIPDVAVIAGSATDDGVPIGQRASRCPGAGERTRAPRVREFEGGLHAGAVLRAAGTYVLQLDASDSELTGSDQVTITVNSGAAAHRGATLAAHARSTRGR